MYLFLDRDGVINQRTPGDYVKTPESFEFEKGVPEAIALLSQVFEKICVVTNQSGIGKEIMSEADLARVHTYMMENIQAAGGRIDAIYYCPHNRGAGCNCRKPAPGMLLQAMAEFPEIKPEQSILVGDSVCDMELALSTGMKAILIEGKEEEAGELGRMALHGRYSSLLDFAQDLTGLL